VGGCVCVCVVCVYLCVCVRERETFRLSTGKREVKFKFFLFCDTPTLISWKTFSHFTGLIGSFNHKPLWIPPFKLIRCTNIFNRKVQALWLVAMKHTHTRSYCDRIPSVWVGKSGEIQKVSSKPPPPLLFPQLPLNGDRKFKDFMTEVIRRPSFTRRLDDLLVTVIHRVK